MKPLYLFLYLSLTFFFTNNALAQKRPFKVKGTLINFKGNVEVFLKYGYGYDSKVISTHMINGLFEFKSKISNPSNAYLYLKNREDLVELFIEPNSEIFVQGEGNFKTAKIEGGLIQSDYNRLQKKLENVNAETTQLVSENKTYKNEQNTEGLRRNEIRWEIIKKCRDSIENQFTKENPSSFVSYNLAKRRASRIDESFEPFFNLLDKKFKDENFEIIGVSLDKNRVQWLEAIQKDGLTWLHVSDLKGWKNEVAKLYDVSFIPQNILINPQGIIIAKNITGVELEMKLVKILGTN